MIARKLESSPSGDNIERCRKGHLIYNQSCKSCEKLKSEWYRYLKQEGFQDIERNEFELDGKTASHLSQRSEAQTVFQFEAKMNYYLWAQEKLNDQNFQNTFSERERMIWEYHADGMPRRQIAPRVGYEHSYISRKIKRMEEFLRVNSISSGSTQLDIFFWSNTQNL